MARVARKYPQGRFILRTPAEVDEEKLYPIYLYYSYNRKQLRQSTSITAMAKDWNQDANHGIGALRATYGQDFRRKNQQLQKMLKKIDGSIYDYVEQNGSINADVIKGFMMGDDNLLRADKGQTFEEYAVGMLNKQYSRHKIRVSTYKNSITITNQFKRFMNEEVMYKRGKIRVGDMTEDLVRDFLSWGLDRGLKTDTVEKYLETISKICRQASIEGLLSTASAKAITDIAIEQSLDEDTLRDIKYLSHDELGKFIHCYRNTLNQKESDILSCFLFSFFACGLRISDVITLRWCDIDFEKKKLNKIQVKTRGRNKIPLANEAIEILRQWQWKHETFVFGLLPDDFDLKDEEKLRTRRNSITKRINKTLEIISKKLQINKKVTMHMSRHSWAVYALEQGMSIGMISSLLGHTSSDITERVYAGFKQDTKAEAVRNLKFNY